MTVLSVHESMVLEKFRAYPTMTIAELCDSTTLTKHDAEVAIRSLKDKGALKRVGARKRGEWIVEPGGFLEVDEK
jgi:predicted HTH transcriptional regulator